MPSANAIIEVTVTATWSSGNCVANVLTSPPAATIVPRPMISGIAAATGERKISSSTMISSGTAISSALCVAAFASSMIASLTGAMPVIRDPTGGRTVSRIAARTGARVTAGSCLVLVGTSTSIRALSSRSSCSDPTRPPRLTES
jgi:hypothetical protein